MDISLKHPVFTGTKRIRQGNFIMTDYMMVWALFLAVMLAMDPFLIYADKRTIFKHFHLMALVPAFILAWLGPRIESRNRDFPSILKTCWPLLLLAAWIISGAMYSRIHNKVNESFLIMGLYMVMVPIFARFIADHKDPTKILNVYFGMLFVSILIGVGWQAGKHGVWSEFHEEEFLTVPLAAFMFVMARGLWGRIFAGVVLVLLMLTVIKNTSFLVAAITCAYLWWGFVRERVHAGHPLRRMIHYFVIVLGVVLIAATYLYIKNSNEVKLPDGNPKYRLYTYELTLEAFKKSPVWGKSFSGAGAEKFGLFTVNASTQVLPTHSDVLDILAQGGVIGMSLFVFALWKIARFIWFKFRHREAGALNRVLVAHFHWIAISALTSVVVFTFNPIMLQPGKSFILWMNLGVLLGLAMRCDVVGSPKKSD